ncbi:MAG: hypothetical protein IT372_04745 [Polyangiaceae bacterium]|nr:hypothetical protein [Polyangiaceae bacterium]
MSRPCLLPLSAMAAAVLAGCAADEALSPLDQPLAATLSVDIRESAALRIDGQGPDVKVRLTLSKGFGVAPAGEALSGPGRVEAFPEAAATLYTARLAAPADPSGPCGDRTVSLALSLHRAGDAAHVGGALTAYCGEGVWSGVPARVLRLSGDIAR